MDKHVFNHINHLYLNVNHPYLNINNVFIDHRWLKHIYRSYTMTTMGYMGFIIALRWLILDALAPRFGATMRWRPGTAWSWPSRAWAAWATAPVIGGEGTRVSNVMIFPSTCCERRRWMCFSCWIVFPVVGQTLWETLTKKMMNSYIRTFAYRDMFFFLVFIYSIDSWPCIST